jgi:hypothetical protein
VTSRRRELAIRAAVGAEQHHIYRLILGGAKVSFDGGLDTSVCADRSTRRYR